MEHVPCQILGSKQRILGSFTCEKDETFEGGVVTKLVSNFFSFKTTIHIILRRRKSDRGWISYKFENWKFEIINEKTINSELGRSI